MTETPDGLGILVSDSEKLIWGLKRIVQMTSPHCVADLSWLLDQLAAEAQAKIPRHTNFDVRTSSVLACFVQLQA